MQLAATTLKRNIHPASCQSCMKQSWEQFMLTLALNKLTSGLPNMLDGQSVSRPQSGGSLWVHHDVAWGAVFQERMTAPCLCCSCLLHIYMTFDTSEWSASNAYVYQVYEGCWEDLPNRCAIYHRSVYVASCELLYLGMTCWVTTELMCWHSILSELGFVYSSIPYFCSLLCIPFCCIYSRSVSFWQWSPVWQCEFSISSFTACGAASQTSSLT